MPLITVYTSSARLGPEQSATLLKRLSSALASELGKPEAYVMTCLLPETRMTFAATTEPACYAAIKNVGTLTPETTQRLSTTLCRLLSEGTGVPQNRIYLEFTSVEPHLFGYDGGTFAD
ncbi:MAG: phenylpyruvate tautomerase MIF-related protein [Pseudomonadota bacterium]|nr:MAG: hypothetical protein DIU78_19100 [Pseudomonadota bacterium]